MSIQSPVGTLDIKNATLRVGKLEVSNIQGVDTALNVTRSNAILIYDDQASTTTFTGFTSTPGVRDTGNGYLDLANGYVYWGQKLPNSWVMEFEMDIRSGTNPGPLYSNIFSSTNIGGNGYSFTFNDDNDKITLKYDGTTLTEATVSGLFTATENWQKVAINYERGRIAISLGASRKFFYQDIERETPYVNGEYINFSSASIDGRKIRNLKITNGTKWTYAGESNVVFQQGSVGIGVTDPQYTLDVGGDINLSGSFYQGGAPFVSSLWTDGSESLYYRSNVEVGIGNLFVDTTTSNVGIGTTTPAYTLDVEGDINFTGNFYQGGSEFVSSLWTDGPDSLYYRSNIEVGTANLFVDTTTGRVGIGTTTPAYELDVVGTINAQIYEGDGGLLSNIASNLETITTNGNVTSNTVQFTNSNVGIVATGNVEANYFIGKGTELEGVALSTDLDDNSSRITTISNDLSDNSSRITNIESGEITLTGDKTFSDNVTVNGNLFVGSNLYVDDVGSNVLVVNGNVAMDALTLTLGQIGIVPSYGLHHVTAEFNETSDTIVLTNASKGLNVSSNIELGGYLKFGSNVLIPNMRIAEFATNVVTYDAVTGEMLDSGGLISNKFSVVSEQPPEALTGASTAIDNHGTYAVSTSASDAHNAFDKSSAHWTSGTSYTGTNNTYNTSIGSRLSSSTEYGEWIRIDFPYKATVRHIAITPAVTAASFPGSANVYGSNDGTTWTEVANWSDVTPSSVTDVRKFAVNATNGYSKYGLVATKAAGSSTSVNIGEWRIFAESFTINGGIMNTTAQISLDNGIQSNLEVGTANLFVDVTTSNVGIGTNTPTARLDVHGTANVGALTASSGTVTGDLTVQGDFIVTGTTVTLDQQNLMIRDPIIEIGKDNLVSPVNDLGLIMTRPSGGNVAIIYDETTSNLEIGYTLGNAEETEIAMDTGNPLNVNINGNLSVANTFTIQSFTLGQTFDLDSVTAVGGDSAQAINITNTDASTNKFTGALKVAGGVGVVGNVYAGKNVDVGANLAVSENLTVTGNVGVSSNLEVGTANLFVDTTTGNVGIGMTDPRHNLDIVSEMNLRSVSNTASIKYNSNVVTEYVRSKKLIKYPRVALTGATTGGYTASASTNIANWDPWKAFNHFTGGVSSQGWHSAGSTYDATGGYISDKYIDDVQGTRYKGEWIKLKLEEKIKLKSLRLTNRTTLDVRNPEDATVLGSNDDLNWYVVGSWVGSFWRNYVNQEFEMDSDTYYQYYAIVVQKCRTAANVDSVQIAEIEFEGVPEYDAEAHGTDVVTRFVPNAASDDHLLLYYDAKDYTSNPANATANTILDLSGNGRHASSNNVTIDTTYGAFVIPSDGGILQAGLTLGFSGDQSHTIAAWFKIARDYTNNPNPLIFDYRSTIGDSTVGGAAGLFVFNSFNKVSFYHHGADINAFAKLESDTWYHLVGTYKEGGTYPTYSSMYLNGEPLGAWSAAALASLSIPSTGVLRVGTYQSAGYNFTGSIGNVRVFGRSLKEREVWQLYASERARFGYGYQDVVSFKNGCMGIGTLEPMAALDVRGTIMGKNPAFFCASKTDGHLSATTDPIIWNNIGANGWITGVNTNKHYGYDSTTGFFTAPVAGHYYFSCYGMNINESYICQLSFYLNNSLVEGTTHYQSRPYGSGGTYAHQTGGMTTIQYMRKGDRMRVKLENGSLYGVGWGFNGFMGFYLSS